MTNSQTGRRGFDPGLPLHVFKASFAWRVLSRYVNGVTANVGFPKPSDSAGHPQLGMPPAEAHTFSRGNITIVTFRSSWAVQVGGRDVTEPPSENWAKTFCSVPQSWTSWLEQAEKALLISCLFCAPTAGIFQTVQSNSTQLARFWKEGG